MAKPQKEANNSNVIFLRVTVLQLINGSTLKIPESAVKDTTRPRKNFQGISERNSFVRKAIMSKAALWITELVRIL